MSGSEVAALAPSDGYSDQPLIQTISSLIHAEPAGEYSVLSMHS